MSVPLERIPLPVPLRTSLHRLRPWFGDLFTLRDARETLAPSLKAGIISSVTVVVSCLLFGPELGAIPLLGSMLALWESKRPLWARVRNGLLIAATMSLSKALVAPVPVGYDSADRRADPCRRRGLLRLPADPRSRPTAPVLRRRPRHLFRHGPGPWLEDCRDHRLCSAVHLRPDTGRPCCRPAPPGATRRCRRLTGRRKLPRRRSRRIGNRHILRCRAVPQDPGQRLRCRQPCVADLELRPSGHQGPGRPRP